MIVRFLGTHNTESKNTRLISLLIDGILALDAGSLVSQLSFAEQKKIKAILLSHGHYDHIRDVPAFAFSNSQRTTKVYATSETLGILSSHLIDGIIYPQLAETTSFLKKRALELVPLEPYKPEEILSYRVTTMPVNHPNHAMGFEVISKNGKRLFYTGDTGPGLAGCWKHTAPELLIVDLTFSNSLEKTALDSGHLCPAMLMKELVQFHRIKGYFPRVVLIHLTPHLEGEIRKEAEQVATELGISLSIAAEGDKITL